LLRGFDCRYRRSGAVPPCARDLPAIVARRFTGNRHSASTMTTFGRGSASSSDDGEADPARAVTIATGSSVHAQSWL